MNEHPDQINPVKLEKTLAEHLAGVGLVGELNLDLDDDLYRESKSVITRVIGNSGPIRSAELYPAAYAIFFTAEARHQYRDGTLWPNFSLQELATSDGQTQTRYHKAYVSALEHFDIDTFLEDLIRHGGHYRVQSFLMQGGIPEYCARDLWQLLRKSVDDGIGDGESLIGKWRRNPFLLKHEVDVPLQHFLRLGGNIAVDLVERMLTALKRVSSLSQSEYKRSASDDLSQEYGLPRYLIRSLMESGERVSTHRSTLRLPKPRIVVDQFSGEGPSVELPPVTISEGVWTVTGKKMSVIQASKYDLKDESLSPSDFWLVQLATYEHSREYNFRGSPIGRLFLFDINGELLRNQERIFDDEILALAPNDIRFTDGEGEPVREPIELPQLLGDWSGWKLTRLSISNLSTVTVRNANDPKKTLGRIPVRRSSGRPRLVGQTDQMLSLTDGSPIYSSSPALEIPTENLELDRWQIRVREGDSEQTKSSWIPLTQFPMTENLVEIGQLFDSPAGFLGQVDVRGPLGSDFHTRLAVFPGIRCNASERVVLPTDKVEAQLSSSIPLNSSGDTKISLSFNTDEGQPTDSARAHILIAGIDTEVMCRCRRVMWQIRERSASEAFGTSPQVRSLDDIVSGRVQAITIRTRAQVSVALELKTDRVSQQTDWKTTVGEDGKWTFPFDVFIDTLTHLQEPHATLDVLIADRRLTVLRVAAQLEISQISTETNLDAETGTTVLNVHWHQQQHFRNRLIRLWPDTRPWDNSIALEIPDDALSEASFVLDLSTKPGRYILEFDVVHTDWAPRGERPTRNARNVKDIFIGIPDQFAKDFIDSVNSEIEEVGRNWLEALAFDAVLRKDPFDQEVIFPIDAELMPYLLTALLWETRETLTYSYDEKRLRRLIFLASRDQVVLAKWASQHLTNWLSQHRLEGSTPELVLALLGSLQSIDAMSLTKVEWDRIWRASPLLGATFTSFTNSAEHAGLWFDHTGWPDPEYELAHLEDGYTARHFDQPLPTIGDPIFRQVQSKTRYELSEIRLQFQTATDPVQDPSDENHDEDTKFRVNRSNRIGPLSPGGQFDAMFDFLIAYADNPTPIENWIDKLPEVVYTRDDTADRLYPHHQLSPWCSVPRHIHRLAQLLVRDGVHDPEVLGSLLKARPFASTLLHRSLLFEIAEVHRQHEAHP